MTARYGFDTSDNVTGSLGRAASNYYGTADFWLRYLSPSPSWAIMTTSSAVSECQAIWDYTTSASALTFICSPTQSRLSGTKAMGTADATTFCSALVSVYRKVAPLDLPTSGQVYVYLDVEASTNLGLNYWNGWASYVNLYNNFGSSYSYPLYAGIYCNPPAPTTNCSTVNNSSAAPCFAIWSSVPEPCSLCGHHFRSISWAPSNCSGKTTVMWQYAEANCCGKSQPNVDVDMTNPGIDAVTSMFYLTGRPA